MVSVVISFIPFLIALFARNNPSKLLIIISSILICVLANIGIILFQTNFQFSLTGENIGGILGAAIGKSILGIFATVIFGYIFKKYLR